jgi:hypothetical protein
MSAAWSAVNAQVPAASMFTVDPLTVQMPGDVEPNTSVLEEGPLVAETLNVPPLLNVGFAGVAVKFVIA